MKIDPVTFEVDVSAGTGIVHSAPAYGVDDYNSCKANGMTNDDILNPVEPDHGDGSCIDPSSDHPLLCRTEILR